MYLVILDPLVDYIHIFDITNKGDDVINLIEELGFNSNNVAFQVYKSKPEILYNNYTTKLIVNYGLGCKGKTR